MQQPPPPFPCLANFVICITFWGEPGRAGGVAGGTGERFILKQFKIFSCNYMSTSRKSRQDNDKDNGENRARSMEHGGSFIYRQTQAQI